MANPEISETLGLFRLVDAQTARLSETTGLRCPPGCGRCCRSHEIMASVLEVLPLALDIYRTGDECSVMDALEMQRENPTCVIFRPDLFDAGKGSCSRYAVRPLVCRLFGFAARRDKYGNLQFSGCGVMKAADPHAHQRAEIGLMGGIPFPVFQEFFMRAAGANPRLGYRVLPINQAIREALETLYWNRPGQTPQPETTEKLAS